MVKNILAFINKEISGIHQAAFLLGFFAIMSQILALIRDRILAATFGADRALDIYYAAFRIPDFLFITVGSLVSMSVLIPFLVEKLDFGKKDAREFIDTIFTFFLATMVLIGLVAFILMPIITRKLFPGFSESDVTTLTILSRVMLISPVFLGISNLFGTLTQVYNRFIVYALSPILYNLGIIIGILVVYPIYGLRGLALGVALGAFLHLAIQVPFVRKSGMMPRIVSRPNFELIKRVTVLSLPRTLTLSAQHIALFALVAIATVLPAGSIAVFSFSFNLQSVPLSIIGASYSLAAFPTLSRLYAANKKQEFSKYFITTAEHIIFWSIPFAVLFIVLRAHVVRLVLGSGAFDWTDTRLTAAVLALFSISLVFQSLTLLFVRGFYAMGNTKKPFIYATVGAISMIFFALLFVLGFNQNETFKFFMEELFKVPDVPGTSVLALGLGFSLGAMIQGIMLWKAFFDMFKGLFRSFVATLFQVFSSSVIMGFFTVVTLRFFDNIFPLERFWGLLGQAVFSSAIGIASGVIMLKILKNKELGTIWRTLHERFWKSRVVGPDPDILS